MAQALDLTHVTIVILLIQSFTHFNYPAFDSDPEIYSHYQTQINVESDSDLEPDPIKRIF